MPKQTYRKLDIAHDYLTVAAELYFAERHFPALGLAGMAEEIFEAVMEARNVSKDVVPGARRLRQLNYVYRPISQDLIKLARLVNPKLRALKDGNVRWLLNRAKNSAKHGKAKDWKSFDLKMNVDPELEAWSMLGRAVENSIRLHYEPQGVVLKFFKLYQAGRKIWHDKGSSEGPHAKPYTIPTRKPFI
jgi:hypothetical protein